MPEALTDALIRHQVFLERYASGVGNRLQLSVNEARDYVINSIISSNVLSVNTKVLQDEAERIIKRGADAALQEVLDLGGYDSEFMGRLLRNEGIDVIIPNKELVEKRINTTTMQVGLATKDPNRKLPTAFDKYSSSQADTLVQKVKDGQTLQQDTTEISSGVAAVTAGLLFMRTRSLARTATLHASTVGKETTLKENKKFVEQVEWVSVLDGQTTNYCRGKDGKRYKVGDGPRPPAHYNCRSLTQPVIKGIDS